MTNVKLYAMLFSRGDKMCDVCEWNHYEEICEEILGNDDMEWCHETVNGIYDWLQKNEHVTPRQKEAIENFYAKMED